MPELAEVKITSNYINSTVKGIPFFAVKKNKLSKNKDINIPFLEFNIHAESRGKELKLKIIDKNKLLLKDSISIFMGLGMSGYFKLCKTGQEPKNTQLTFLSRLGFSLCYVDARKFGKWRIDTKWSNNRGPDPAFEFNSFTTHILSNLHKRVFEKPIYLLLMDQRWFNGIGNYLRAEILYRANIDPFQSARSAILKSDSLLELCRDIPLAVYNIGGGELKDWKNPFNSVSSIQNLIVCYNNPKMYSIRDKLNRRFWFDPKWETNYYLNN